MTSKPNEGVFYQASDCAGIFRRLLITTVDLAVVITGLYLLLVAASLSETAARLFVPVSLGPRGTGNLTMKQDD